MIDEDVMRLRAIEYGRLCAERAAALRAGDHRKAAALWTPLGQAARRLKDAARGLHTAIERGDELPKT